MLDQEQKVLRQEKSKYQEVLQKLQKAYLDNRCNRTYDSLYKGVQAYVHMVVIAKLRKSNSYNAYSVEESVNDVTNNFMLNYLKSPDWICSYFPTRIGYDVLAVLYGTGKTGNRRFYEKNVHLDDDADFIYEETKSSSIEEEPLLDELKDLRDDKGNKILYELYKAPSFKDFLLTIEHKYVSVQWIHDHIHSLKRLYSYVMESKRRKYGNRRKQR